ncbi:MAG: hypothetical protein KKE20_05735 [Nanoarchaeota archaeon]|nr:hypothetical protein [Nanoarchaeota archaeon]
MSGQGVLDLEREMSQDEIYEFPPLINTNIPTIAYLNVFGEIIPFNPRSRYDFPCETGVRDYRPGVVIPASISQRGDPIELGAQVKNAIAIIDSADPKVRKACMKTRDLLSEVQEAAYKKLGPEYAERLEDLGVRA